MLIRDLREEKITKKFGDIPFGDTFISEKTGELYLKMYPVCSNTGRVLVNCISLNAKICEYFQYDDTVYPVDVTLTINNISKTESEAVK